MRLAFVFPERQAGVWWRAAEWLRWGGCPKLCPRPAPGSLRGRGSREGETGPLELLPWTEVEGDQDQQQLLWADGPEASEGHMVSSPACSQNY